MGALCFPSVGALPFSFWRPSLPHGSLCSIAILYRPSDETTSKWADLQCRYRKQKGRERERETKTGFNKKLLSQSTVPWLAAVGKSAWRLGAPLAFGSQLCRAGNG